MFALVTGVQTCALPISRIVQLLLQPVELLRPHALQLLRIEGGVADIVGEQRERRTQIGRQREQAEDRLVGIRRAVDLRAEPLLGLGKSDRIEARRPLVHQAQHQRLGAERTMRVGGIRSEEHTSELQSLMRISYAVFCLKKKKQ